jgi:hypothetical protein
VYFRRPGWSCVFINPGACARRVSFGISANFPEFTFCAFFDSARRQTGKPWPRVAIRTAQPGHMTTKAELEELGLVAAPQEFARFIPSSDRPGTGWPDYEISLRRAPLNRAGTGPDRSKDGPATRHFPAFAGARAREGSDEATACTAPRGQGQDAARRDFVLNQRGAEDLLSPSSVMRSATGSPIYPGCPVMGSGSKTVQRATKREFHGSLAPENPLFAPSRPTFGPIGPECRTFRVRKAGTDRPARVDLKVNLARGPDGRLVPCHRLPLARVGEHLPQGPPPDGRARMMSVACPAIHSLPGDSSRAPMTEVRQSLARAITALADEVEGLEESIRPARRLG